MPRKFAELRAKMSPQSRLRSRAKAEAYRAEMALDELREARQLTQENLAALLNVRQASISKMERRTDMYISTLRSMIQAMGGDLLIEAVFPEGKIRISQFRKLRRPAA